uniref:Hexosyltransferase n=1 Tax=Dendrobium officinale TaxID=142615 RepID=A0A077EWC5_DENOF|nr:putative glucuronosyltransferase PGSIP6-like protein [Dendrobium officinale]
MGCSRSILGLLVVVWALTSVGRSSARSEEAYVTLLYGDELVLGARVLGKSIRDTGSSKDMVVLVSDGVSDYAKMLLQADGWKVELISLLTNPNQVRPKRFWGVYTKLKIFNMTMYKKVVYLDADTIVVKNIEDLFQCRRFCANLKHSERLNSGVMVVEPSDSLFKDMMSKVNSLPSYTGGDQGFLNSFYGEFANAHLFEPNLPEDVRKSRPVPEMERLSTLYNADVGLYMLANKWMVDERELKVIHYALGPIKPWDWWAAWLVKPVEVWQNARMQLKESLPGTGGGTNPSERLLIKFLFAFPIIVLLICYYRSCSQVNADLLNIFSRSSICDYARRFFNKYRSGGGLPTYSAVGVTSSSMGNSNQQFLNGANSKVPAYLGPVSTFFCFTAALLSLALSFIIIPRQVTPRTGLLLTYEWTFVTFFVVFGSYLRLVYNWGRLVASQAGKAFSQMDSSNYDSGKGHQRPSSNWGSVTCFYGTGMAFLAVIVPSLPFLFGISALFARLGVMIAGGILLSIFMTYASEHLALTAFVKGTEDRDLPRTRTICFFC